MYFMNTERAGWLLLVIGCAFWVYGYFSLGLTSLVDWRAVAPSWFSDFFPNLEAEIGFFIVILGSVLVYWQPVVELTEFKAISHLISDIVASLAFPFAMPFLIVAARKRYYLRTARALQDWIGVTVVRNHYYQPIPEPEVPTCDQPAIRFLPGLDLNITGQIETLNRFQFAGELIALECKTVCGRTFTYKNGMFEAGDAEALYSFIRAYKPQTLIEIGAGNSSLVARMAVDANTLEDPTYFLRHVCFEPYENPWLEGIGAEIRRERIETVDLSIFQSLKPNDILFIDSSHVLRPGGDVEAELLRIVPSVPAGVLVHVHDVFTPRDYSPKWLIEERRLWNEQYFLEAFLSFNTAFEVVLALNDLFHSGQSAVNRAFPVLAATPDANPGSFWIRRR